MSFRNFLESTYYHGTTQANADSILKNGIDPTQYKSGMFQGFYITNNLSYFQHREKEAVIELEIDDSRIMDANAVTDQDLQELDPHFRNMSYGWRNTLITKLAQQRGFGGIRNGKEVVLLNNEPIKSMNLLATV